MMGLINHDRQLPVYLDAQASTAQLELNYLYNLDAPISVVPREVLAMIFEAGVDPREPSFHFGVLVSHVTRRWRDVSLGTPKLWNSIRCIAQDDISPYPEKSIERASTFISRARSLPLDVSVECFCDAHISVNFLQLISDHIGHCRQLRIVNGEHRGLMRVLKCISSQSMPLLASIDLGCFDNDLGFQEQLFPSGGHRLATARIADVKMRTMHFCLPAFESLTALQLTGIRTGSWGGEVRYILIRDTLMALPSLRHLELIIDCFNSFPGRLPILLPTIEHLHVGGGGTSDLGNILCCIQAASLVALSLSWWNIKDLESFMLVIDALNFPSLQRLVLTDIASTMPVPATFVAFARGFPHIECLTFEPGENADPSFHDIHRILSIILGDVGDGDRAEKIAHNGPLWPKLQSIALSTTREQPDFDAPNLQSTILNVQAAGHPIRQLLLPRKAYPAMVELEEIIGIEEFYIDWPMPFDW